MNLKVASGEMEDANNREHASGVKTEEIRKGRIWGGVQGYLEGYVWKSFPCKHPTEN